jgi:hypothetical protein
MPITLNCSCGKILRIADQHAGKRVKCPACNGILTSTPPQPAFEVVEDEPKQVTSDRLLSRRHEVNDDDDESYSVRRAERTANRSEPQPTFRKRGDEEDDDEPRPSKNKKKRRSSRTSSHDGPSVGKRIGYVISGTGSIVIGALIAYFGGSGEGRSATRSLIFGIALAIGGVIVLFKGLTGNISDDE